MGITKKRIQKAPLAPEISEPEVSGNWETTLGKYQDIVILALISFFASSSDRYWEEDPELVDLFS